MMNDYISLLTTKKVKIAKKTCILTALSKMILSTNLQKSNRCAQIVAVTN